MSPPIYYWQQAKLSFADVTLFNNTEFYIHKFDRICLIGRNGSGKSSLFKTIAGIYELDSGKVYEAPNLKINYLQQKLNLDMKQTCKDFLLADIDEQIMLTQMNEYEQLIDKLAIDADKKIAELSGGQIQRLKLAKTLLNEPDIILLDEPTNHLDITTIEWLENYLRNLNAAIICISHDRKFLENISNKVWWLDRGEIKQLNQSFTHFDDWQEQLINQEQQRLEKMAKLEQAESEWLAKGVTARRKRNVRRLYELKRLRAELQAKNSHFNKSKVNLDIDAIDNSNKSKFILEARDLGYQLPNGKWLFKDFNIKIKKGEKIGVVGANGSGKTTLIRNFIGKLEPTEGRIKRGKTLDITYFEQMRDNIDLDESLWKTICDNGGDTVFLANGKSLHVVAYLKKFMFNGAQAKAKVSTLSGGELNRLLLAKQLINPGNFLVLDEPTNDLDVDSIDMLLEILSDYEGTVIIVSHDRDFLDKLTERNIIFDENKIVIYYGNYDDYRAQFKEPEAAPSKNNKAKNTQAEPKTANKTATKLSYKDARNLDILPNEISDLEKKVKQTETALAEDNLYNKNPDRFFELTNQLTSLKQQIAEKEEKLLESMLKQEELENQPNS